MLEVVFVVQPIIAFMCLIGFLGFFQNKKGKKQKLAVAPELDGEKRYIRVLHWAGFLILVPHYFFVAMEKGLSAALAGPFLYMGVLVIRYALSGYWVWLPWQKPKVTETEPDFE